jgi:hypothetical protein
MISNEDVNTEVHSVLLKIVDILAEYGALVLEERNHNADIPEAPGLVGTEDEQIFYPESSDNPA